MITEPDRNPRAMLYVLAGQLQTKYMEKGDSQLKFAKRPAVLKVWPQLVGAKIVLDFARNEELYVLITGERPYLRGHDRLDWTGHMDFEVWEGQSPDFLHLLLELSPYLC